MPFLPLWLLMEPLPVDKVPKPCSAGGILQGINLKPVLELGMPFHMNVKKITDAIDIFDPMTVGFY